MSITEKHNRGLKKSIICQGLVLIHHARSGIGYILDQAVPTYILLPTPLLSFTLEFGDVCLSRSLPPTLVSRSQTPVPSGLARETSWCV